jgi:hypothetical protein
MEQLNIILKNTLNTNVIKQNDDPDIYVDYLNLACLFAGVRNGVHLDNIQNDELMYNLTEELVLLGYKFNTRYETTIWNLDKITMDQVEDSWAFKGDACQPDEYWVNNAILLGNSLGYPTFTNEALHRGSWSLNLRINSNRNTSYPISMMGGCYDKTKEDDLRSIKIIKIFLESLIGHELYNPNGDIIYLEKVELQVK